MSDPSSTAPPGDVDRLIGRELAGRYRVHTLLGEGGMGSVFRATDVRLGRDVAVKVLRVEGADAALGEAMRRRFRIEAHAAAALRHPNVVTVHDFGTDAALGEEFLVMELLPGRDVAARLAEAGGPLPPAEALEIFREAGMGVAAGHRAGMVHRDVKPRNIFLVADPEGGWEVKVVDFGIAWFQPLEDTDGDGRPGPHTPRYAAPEQLSGAPVTPAADVFSLALTALELLTGRHPSEVQTAADDGPALRLLGALRAARALTPAVADVLCRALHPDPARRFATAGEMLGALYRAEQSSAAVHPPSSIASIQSVPSASSSSAAAPEDEGTVLFPAPPGSARRAPDSRANDRPRAASARSLEGKGVSVLGLLVSLFLTGLVVTLAFFPSLAAPVLEGAYNAGKGIYDDIAASLAPESPQAPWDWSADPRVVAASREEFERVRNAPSGVRGLDGELFFLLIRTYAVEDIDEALAFRNELRGRGFKVGLATPLVYSDLPAGRIEVIAGPYPLRDSREKSEMYEAALGENVFIHSLRLAVRAP
jgi:serine/threonine protein kinase